MLLQLRALILLILLTPQVRAIGVETAVYVNIHKPASSSSIAIEYDKDTFISIYRLEEQKFDDVVIPFRVVSSLTELNVNYNLALVYSQHVCDDIGIDVTTELDGVRFSEGQTVYGIEFENENPTYRWNNHHINMSFPTINMKKVEQRCVGNIGITVGLEI